MTIGGNIGVIAGARCSSEVGANADEESSPERLVVLWGQSNAHGLGDIDLVTVEEGLDAEYPAVTATYHFANGWADPLIWTTKGPWALQPYATGGSFGTELSLLRRLDEAEPGRWNVVKCSCSGAFLGGWQGFNPDAAAPDPDNLFDQALAFTVAAMTTYGVQAANTVLVWIQGEADANNEAYSLAYSANLAAFMAALRATIPGVTIYYNRLSDDLDLPTYPYRENVQAQQDAYLLLDTGAELVDTTGLTLQDTAHYDDDSLVVLGNRFAASILEDRALSTLTVSPDTLTVDVGDGAQQFSAVGAYDNSAKRNLTTAVTWSSSDTNVATVNATTGVVTPVDAGTCTITATLGLIQDTSGTITVTDITLPEFKAVGTFAHGAFPATIVPTWPTHAAGDYAMLFVESTTGLVLAPAGWTEIADSPNLLRDPSTAFQVFTRVAAGSSETNPDVVSVSNHVSAVIVTFTGVHATAIDVSATGESGGSGVTTLTFPAVTTTGTGRLIVLATSWSIDNADAQASNFVNTALTSLTERVDVGTTDGNGGGIIIATGGKVTAGDTGTTAADLATSTLYTCFTIALVPA